MLMMLPSLQAFAAEEFKLALSATEVRRGGELVVSGTVPDDRSDVAVKIVSPGGTVFLLEAVKPSGGQYFFRVSIPALEDFAPLGRYTVAAGYGEQQKTATFDVVVYNGGGVIIPPPSNEMIPPDAGQASQGNVKPEQGENGTYIAGRNTLASAVGATGDSVMIELPAAAAERGDALEIPAESLQAIDESKKDIILTSGGLRMTFPAGAIGAYGSGDSRIRISVNTSWTAEAQGIVERSIASNDSLLPVGMALSVVIELVSADGATAIHEMKEPVTVSLKLTEQQERKLRLELAGVYDVDGQKAEYVRGHVRDGVFTFDAAHFSYYAVLEYDKAFADMVGHWALASVKSLAAKYIVNGVDELHYQPERSIKRADFAVMLMRTLDWQGAELPETGSSAFADVEMDSYYGKAVGIAAKLGIVAGYNGKFRPNDVMTREEAAVALARALPYLGLENSASGSPTFGDQGDISNWAMESVGQAWATGLIKGDDKGRFNPKSSLTRAQVATMMERALNQHS